jgi:hypothetical protein
MNGQARTVSEPPRTLASRQTRASTRWRETKQPVNGTNSKATAPRPRASGEAMLNNSNELFEYPKWNLP